MSGLTANAVVLNAPERLAIEALDLKPPQPGELVVDIEYTGISTGTERLLWSGNMPDFPGMGYPLVPGYEAVGKVVRTVPGSEFEVGDTVFVPGANCYEQARGLFGAAASQVVVPASRVVPVAETLGERGALLALAATARHAIAGGDRAPELIVGHGVLGRLMARLTVALGAPAPVVWETARQRRGGAEGYTVIDPDSDPRRDYQTVYDVSGDSGLLNELIQRLAKGGEVVLAGFYNRPLQFDFAPAFMKEARIRIAAEWQPDDLRAVNAMADANRLCLGGLITHHEPVAKAESAYRTAFGDSDCLKMILDWR